MDPNVLGAFIALDSTQDTNNDQYKPATPQKAVARTYLPQASQPLDPLELENLQWNAKPRVHSNAGIGTPSGMQTPIAPNDIETSRPPSPLINDRNEFESMQSFSSPPMNRFRLLSACLLNFGSGLNDSAPGALIPYMEKHYHIGYAVVSLIFITNALGFISAAFFIDALRARLGRAKTLMVGQVIMTCGYLIIIWTPPFPLVVFSFFFSGVAMAISLSLGNVFAANLQHGTTMLGFMHGSYGLGGTLGPLIATTIVTSGRLPWSRYYLLTLAVAVANLLFAGWAFWRFEAESTQPLMTELEQRASRAQNQPSSNEGLKQSHLANMLKALKSKQVILGALFVFAYQGAEVSISGWIISFLIANRNGTPSKVGYVTSGFWGGITIGRFFLSHPAHKVGEKLFVYCVVVGAAAFELIVWLVPNIVGDAVAVAIVGLLLGPVYPCAAAVFSGAVGRQEQVNSLSVISAIGSAGGAMAPFTTGILAQAVGTFVLHPIAIGLFGFMLVCWYCLPKSQKRSD